MFNPKERLEQIRKNKEAKTKEEPVFTPDSPPPLFSTSPPDHNEQSDLLTRLARLENTVNELSSELSASKQTVSSLKRENSELETKIIKLEYQNSQLKISSKVTNEKPQESPYRQSAADRSKEVGGDRDESDFRRMQSNLHESVQENLLPEVEETLEQIKKEPIENILKRKQQNFRALKVDPRQVSSGNKMLREFAGICKDYNKSIKKPVLVIKLQASDFE